MPKVSDILERKNNKDVVSVSMDTKAVEGAAILSKHKIGVLLCCDDDGRLVGIFSERDVVKAFAERSSEVSDLLVRDLATSDVTTCTSGDDLKSVTAIMGRGGFRHLPVMENGSISGLISVTDIFRYLNDSAAPHERSEILAAYATMSLPT